MKITHCGKRKRFPFASRQTLLAMKLAAFLLTTTLIGVYAKTYTQTVTYQAKNVPLEQVFAIIKQQTGYVFFYNDADLKAAKPVTVSFNKTPLLTALDESLKSQPFHYTIQGRTILVATRATVLPAVATSPVTENATIDVHGVVKDENGKPAVGVAVRVKGVNKMTTTNENGEFSLSGVDANAILVFSSINMETFEIKVNGRNDFAVTLKTKTTALEDVAVTVNTGYQKISKERFVGSYAQLDSANFHRRVGMGIIDRLDGTVPGVLFNKKGSSNDAAILIRGLSTLGDYGLASAPTSTDPLIVVDNFPMPSSFDLNSINPNDVENITVLRDAAAASIWGARAGNGVIVITTKKGRYNQRFQINASTNITIEQKPDLYYYKQVTPSDYIDMEKYLFSKGAYDAAINDAAGMPVLSPVVQILDSVRRNLLSQNDGDAEINTLRNYDLRQQLNNYVYKEAVKQQHYLAFSGGTNNLAYQVSGGYNRSLSNLQGSKPDEQYTFTTNTTFKPARNLEITAGINMAFAKNKSTSLPSLPPFPYGRLKDDKGSNIAIPFGTRSGYVDTVGGGQLLDWHYRPLDEIAFADNTVSSRFVRLNIGVSYRFTSWLKANVNYQYQNISGDSRKYNSLQSYFTRDLINSYTNLGQTSSNLKYPVPMGGILDLSQFVSKDYNLRGTINIDKNFGQHQINAILGGEIYDSKGGYSSGQRIYGYNDQVGIYSTYIDYSNTYPNFYAPGSGGYFYIPNPNYYLEGTVNRTVSLLANANYSFKDRYNLYASARRDGANVFGVKANNQWKPLWSIGGGWELSKENFYKISCLPYFKLRISYGYTGNVNNLLSGLFTITHRPDLDPYTFLPYNLPNLAPNYNLKWEQVRIINEGIDFLALKDRIAGSFEIFTKNSSDVIAQAPMPPSSGVNTFVKNFADMKTNGYEINLNSKNIKGKIEWTSNFGWSHAKTIITKLFTTFGSKVNDYLNYSLNAVPGQIIYGLSSYRWAGLDPLTGDPQGYLHGQISKNYNAILNDSIQNQVFHGSALPLNTVFLRNNVSWKGFMLSMNITGRFDYYFREPAIDITGYPPTLNADYYNRWQKPGDEVSTDIPSIYYPVSNGSQRNQFYQFASNHVKKADNIRVQDVSLSYQLTNTGKKRIPFQSARLFFYLNNLNWIIWRAEKSNWDPDFGGGGSGGNIIATPPSKTWTIGATVNF